MAPPRTGKRRQQFCRKHATDGMGDLDKKKCAHQSLLQHAAVVWRSVNQEARILHITCRERDGEPSQQHVRTPGLQQTAVVWGSGNKEARVLQQTCRGRDGGPIAKKCARQGCIKYPSFGVAEAKKRRTCPARDGELHPQEKVCSPESHHAAVLWRSGNQAPRVLQRTCRGKDVVNLEHDSVKKCAHQDCGKCPTLGAPEAKKRELWGGDARQGMVNLINNNKCSTQSCNKRPSYGEREPRR